MATYLCNYVGTSSRGSSSGKFSKTYHELEMASQSIFVSSKVTLTYTAF